jgi:hypothetical protein
LIATGALLVGAFIAIAAPSHPTHARRGPSRPAVVADTPQNLPAAPSRRHPPIRSPTRRWSRPAQIARGFLRGWLGCTYHQTSCSRISGLLPAYADALVRYQGHSLATPDELAARPRIVAIRLVPSCPGAEVALATYQDGSGGRFQLHINLVREPAGWRVFDVAEAPPHIPLPKPLPYGPRGC